MTTIAYRDGILAADTLACSESGLRSSSMVKIMRVRGGLAGTVGKCSQAQAIVRWLEDGRAADRPKFADGSDDYTVVWLPDEGEATLIENGGEEPLGDAPYHAFGSGREIALGAMYMGATAKEAVEAAIAISVWSGGDVTVLKLKTEALPAVRAA